MRCFETASISLAVGSLLLAACTGATSTSPPAEKNPPQPTPPATSTAPSKPPKPPTDPRQALRDASIFENLDFEEVDAKGTPGAWTCACASGPSACKTGKSDPKHGTRSLVLSSGCYAEQTVKKFDSSKGVRFDLYAAGGALMPMDVAIYGSYPTAGTWPEALYTDGVPAAPHGWADVPSRGAMPTTGEGSLTLRIMNTNGVSDATPGPDLRIDDVIAVQDEANPPPKVGSVIRATHIDEFGLAASPSPSTVYVSLPSHWASQVPLYVDLQVTPSSVVQSIEYATETEDNWGAAITLMPGAGAPDVVIRWEAVALVRAVPDDELPTVFASLSSPSQWLSASDIVESTDTGIAGTAAGLDPSATDAVDKMLAVIGWTSANVTYGFSLSDPALDALTAYTTRESTCTGYANLSSAMSRALNLPARHVTNILLGMGQDMHSIAEFYLGPSLGWRRVEPQATSARVPDDYGFVMRLVMPADESPVANRNSPGGELQLGIPYHEFTEALTGASSVYYLPYSKPTFTDCSQCTNRADPQATLRDASPAAMKSVFDRAKTAWKKTLAEYASGGLPASEIAARKAAVSAASLADVRALVASLP